MANSFQIDIITPIENINLGIAVSVDGGLMVPCIKRCDEKSSRGAR